MKKNMIAGAICASLFMAGSAIAAPKTSTIDVTFTGSVVDTPCIVEVGNGQTVNLGQVKVGANAKGIMTQVPFKLTGCTESADTSEGKFKIALKTSDQGPVTDNTLKTNDAAVSVKLYKDKAGSQALDQSGAEFTGTQWTATAEYTLPLFAQLEATDQAKPGAVSATATFTLTYL